jgi:hypothetical protein
VELIFCVLGVIFGARRRLLYPGKAKEWTEPCDRQDVADTDEPQLESVVSQLLSDEAFEEDMCPGLLLD